MNLRIAMLTAGLLLVGGCATTPWDQMAIREGLLQPNIRQQAFLYEWGKPTRTSVTTGDEIMKAGVNKYGGFFFKGKLTYEVWSYEGKETTLVFSRKQLIAWQTDETVQQLSAPGY